MSKSKESYPKWFLWLLDRGIVGFIITLLIIMLSFGAAAYYLDERLNAIEGKLTYQPPRNYERPKPEDYPAGNVAAADLVIRNEVYVPVYSHVYYQGGRPYLLETTLSLRNTDIRDPMFIDSVRYYDSRGQLAEKHLETRIKLEPLQTIEFLVEQQDARGGSGANFIVQWQATKQISEPIIEAVMVGTTGTQGICLRSPGKTLRHEDDEA